MLTLSPSAVEAVGSILDGPDIPDEAGLRIRTAGESQLAVELTTEPAPGDQIIEEGAARVFIEDGVAPLLDDAELDVQRDGDEIAFALKSAAGGSDVPSSRNGSSPR
jgi:Fe-S cluster assembly iron-binding protein IscA